MFLRKKEVGELSTAKQSYKDVSSQQLSNYIEEINKAKERGNEHCYMLSSSYYPMRPEHVEVFTKKGYDIYLRRYKSILHEKEFDYFAECSWTKESSVKVFADYNWNHEQTRSEEREI